MGFYRIIKKTIKFILYQMPKKWLIMIIFALFFSFGLTKVKAVDYIDAQDIMQENVEFYDYLDIGNNVFDTDISPSLENSTTENRLIFLDFYCNHAMYGQLFNINEDTGSNSYPIDTNQDGIKLEYNRYSTGNNSWFRCNRTWNTQYSFELPFETEQSLFLDFVHKNATLGNITYDFSSYIQNDFYTTKTMLLNSNAQNSAYRSSVYRVYNLSAYIYATSNGLTIPVLIHNYYACKYVNALQDEIYGFFDTVTGDILVFARNPATPPLLGEQIDTPITPDNPISPDYTENLNQIDSSINDMNDNIMDDNINNSSIQQPSVPQDTTGVESGVNNIFTAIMNVFTNLDTTQDVILPIPFTNKSITIAGSYTRDMLTQSGATWLLSFITLFWWYIISRFIIKDVLKSVDKIQTGDVEHLENSNIKGDML